MNSGTLHSRKRREAYPSVHIRTIRGVVDPEVIRVIRVIVADSNTLSRTAAILITTMVVALLVFHQISREALSATIPTTNATTATARVANKTTCAVWLVSTTCFEASETSSAVFLNCLAIFIQVG